MSATDRPQTSQGGGSPSRLRVVVDEATIDTAGWRAIDLTGAGLRIGGTRQVVARFGALLPWALNDNRSGKPANLAMRGGVAEILPFRLVAANDPFGAPEAPAPVAPPGSLRRVYRPVIDPTAGHHAPVDEPERRPEAVPAQEPQRIMPLPADAPLHWQSAGMPARRGGRQQGIDRASLPLLIALMVLAWAVVMGIGLYKGLNPTSGAAIKWDN